ncbi:DUF418 domain-containing protein [Bacillus carboniphilus]|uniref:DUF418 domain-containing protein n=1 Tax=Bacillus carboniphilus TaxID=86663 RepID=A0ABN0VQ45_9BACI
MGQRIIGVDFARGISLFGILLINMMSFHSPYVWVDSYGYWEGSGNHILFLLIEVFVGASFYPLFALLFGFGAIKIFEKSMKLELKPKVTLVRRFFFLLIIGLIHALLIWNGDILVTYAVTGFILLLLINFSHRAQLTIGVLLWSLPNVLLFLLTWLAYRFMPEDQLGVYDYERAAASQLYADGGFWEITKLRVDEWLYINGAGGILIVLFSVLPMVLFGAAMAKGGFIQKHSPGYFIKKGILLLAIGLFIKVLPLLTSYEYPFILLKNQIGGPIVAIAYFFICLGVVKGNQLGVLQEAIVRAGKLSITLYLTQSIVCTFIFYGYGLGLYGKVELWEGTILALAIYCVQLVFSYFWFKKYKTGPVEWLWRWFTYKEKPDFKKGE